MFVSRCLAIVATLREYPLILFLSTFLYHELRTFVCRGACIVISNDIDLLQNFFHFPKSRSNQLGSSRNRGSVEKKIVKRYRNKRESEMKSNRMKWNELNLWSLFRISKYIFFVYGSMDNRKHIQKPNWAKYIFSTLVSRTNYRGGKKIWQFFASLCNLIVKGSIFQLLSVYHMPHKTIHSIHMSCVLLLKEISELSSSVKKTFKGRAGTENFHHCHVKTYGTEIRFYVLTETINDGCNLTKHR